LKRQKVDVLTAWAEVERRELTGTWQTVAYTRDGNKASDQGLPKIKLVIDANGRATALRSGETFFAGTTRLDPTTDPMSIDVTYTEGESKGKTAFGIFKIEGDLLTICRALPGQVRPTEFASAPGNGHLLMTYKRENPATTTIDCPPAVRQTL